ncbi:hypothetical protein QBC35DRAFT_505918 [Podospora australis]|uniref:Cation-transporting P-type ATPase N-terminal domain-containing protein n=1 Tax=Podospora australis TaxID=1536484 RepID=A0AAN6WM88_9PEZI|nr:hypothetical protein QBC35DRAFT_505918 [Podospora australis]
MDNAFAKSNEEVLSTLGVNPTTGLTDEQVSTLQAKHGKNGMSSTTMRRNAAFNLPQSL